MPGDWSLPPGPLLLVALGALLYGGGVRRLAARGRSWPPGRTLAFAGGCAAVLLALASPLAAAEDRFPVHMLQHLLLGMLAPLLLALSAPVTLALRALGARRRRALVRLLRSRVVRVLGFAPLTTALYVGTLWALYLTPLYAASLDHAWLHEAVHVHVLVGGCLFLWPLVGIDPAPHRPSVRVRLGLLLAAFGLHGALAKLLAAGHLGGGLVVPAADLDLGAQVMWYGGDAIDVLIVVALLWRPYRAEGRQLARARAARGAA